MRVKRLKQLRLQNHGLFVLRRGVDQPGLAKKNQIKLFWTVNALQQKFNQVYSNK